MPEKPIISKDFMIDDIHKIREYNYEVTKGMTFQKKVAYYNAKGEAEREKLIKDELIEA